MRTRAKRLGLAPALACAALLFAAGAAVAEPQEAGDTPRPRVYRWIDENGIAHYTTDPQRIPSRLRDAVGLPHAGESVAAPRSAPSEPSAAGSTTLDPLAMDRGPASPAPLSERSDAFDEGPAAAPASAPSDSQRADLDARIAALEAEIAADEETIQAMISAAEPGPGALAADDPAFREVAERLPKRLADLRALEQERAQLGEP